MLNRFSPRNTTWWISDWNGSLLAHSFKGVPTSQRIQSWSDAEEQWKAGHSGPGRLHEFPDQSRAWWVHLCGVTSRVTPRVNMTSVHSDSDLSGHPWASSKWDRSAWFSLSHSYWRSCPVVLSKRMVPGIPWAKPVWKNSQREALTSPWMFWKLEESAWQCCGTDAWSRLLLWFTCNPFCSIRIFVS